MSEYQYYEFVALDRRLDADQQHELRGVSSRAEITPTSFVARHHWGDLQADPRDLVRRYFDAFLYRSNWGVRWVMFRLPRSLLDLETAQRSCACSSELGAAGAWATDESVVVELRSNEEEGYWEENGDEVTLAPMVGVRAELASGDRRLLYLGWLLSAQAGELADDATEPPVPAGLASLSPSLLRLAKFLRLDEELLDVAGRVSPPKLAGDPQPSDVVSWAANLPTAEKDALLARAVLGDPHLAAELERRYRDEHHGATDRPGTRTVAELRNAAAQLPE